MKRAVLTVCASLFFFYLLTTKTQATCADTWAQQNVSLSATCGNSPNAGALSKSVTQKIYWLDGYERPVVVTEVGQTSPQYFQSTDCARCWPDFYTPYWTDDGTTAYWFQKTYPGVVHLDVYECTVSTAPSSDHRQGHTCSCGEGCSEEWPGCTHIVAEEGSSAPTHRYATHLSISIGTCVAVMTELARAMVALS